MTHKLALQIIRAAQLVLESAPNGTLVQVSPDLRKAMLTMDAGTPRRKRSGGRVGSAWPEPSPRINDELTGLAAVVDRCGSAA